jgi:adenylate cyclase
MAAAKKPKSEDLDFQMGFYEGIVKENPDFADALIALGEIYTKKGFYAKGLKVDKKLVKLKPDSSIVHYNLACSHSLLGDIESSFKALKRAVALGYDDFTFMHGDPDLLNLRQDERFTEFVMGLKKNRLTTEETRETRG